MTASRLAAVLIEARGARPYLARGMSGQECIGIVAGSIPYALREALRVLANELKTQTVQTLVVIYDNLLQRAWVENASDDVIVYWPHLKWPEGAIIRRFEKVICPHCRGEGKILHPDWLAFMQASDADVLEFWSKRGYITPPCMFDMCTACDGTGNLELPEVQ